MLTCSHSDRAPRTRPADAFRRRWSSRSRWLPAAAALVLAWAASAAAGPARRASGPAVTPMVASPGVTITAIELRDARGALTRTLSPTDTFFVDVLVADTSGFRNVKDAEVGVALSSATGIGMATWQGARILWQRGVSPAWTFHTSKSAGWRLFDSLCSVDTLTNSPSPQRIRFAFSPCTVARADTANWVIQAWTGTVTAKATPYRMLERTEWVALDSLGAFAAGAPGATGLPLSAPSTGRLSFRLVTNTDVALAGRSPAFRGVSNPAATFGGGAVDTTLRWLTPDVKGTTAGYFDSLAALIGSAVAALLDTTALPLGLELQLALAAGLPPQAYRSSLSLSATSASGAAVTHEIALAATVLGSGVAAHSATAEVEPHRVPAGTVSQPMIARLGFLFGLGETGVDRVRVALPAGWTSPRVTGVTSSLGLPLAFRDRSTAGSAIADLDAKQILGPLRVDFTVDVPTLADPAGAGFVTYFDDTTTAVPEQVATEGNPDLLGESGWLVVVDPAAAAAIDVTPAAAQLLVGDTLTLAAVVSDAWGNVRPADPVSWTAVGGAGTVNASGRYLALAAGGSLVIGSSGSLADTARVDVGDPSASFQLSVLAVPSASLLPAGGPTELARVLVRNPSTRADTVDALGFDDVSVGPTFEQDRAGSWTSFELRDSTGNRLATAYWVADQIHFESLALPVPPGAGRRLRIYGAASTRARDGDSLGVAIQDGGGLTLRSGRPVTLGGPGAPQRFPVDGMSAAQVTLEPMATGPIFAGSRRRAITELRVPANGWAPDRLLRLNIVNHGTAEAGTDLSRIEAWRDDGDHLLDTLADVRLGSLVFTGERWEITGLAVDVPDSGACLLLSVDVPAGARDGRTVRLDLPGPPDVALGMASGNSGPIDHDVVATHEDIIGGGERVLVTATQLAGGTVHAGQRDVPVMELVLANGYTEDRHLRSLMIANVSTGAGTGAQLDSAIANLALGAGPASSPDATAPAPPLARASFVNGRAAFDGLDLTVPAGGELRLHFTIDVDPARATDGDRFAVSLASPQDLQFAEATTAAGTWPAASGSTWRVDGFVAAQSPVNALPGLTLAPGDGPVASLDFGLPANGYLADVLHSVRVVNLGDAAPAEIAELRLYRDGGDGRLGGPAPDDTDLGPLVPIGGQWQSAYLAEPVPVGGRRYFVGLTVAGSTSDSSTVRLAVPAGGVEMESGDDGPLDAAVENPEPHVLSTRPLLATLGLDPASSTIGQQVDVRLTVRNVGSETFGGVTPGALAAEGTASWQPVSGPAPAAVDLAPGDTATFTWTVASTSAGDLRFATTAAGTGQSSLLERRTLVAHSPLHRVYMESDSLRLLVYQSMPTAVNRGQAGVVPLTLTLEHPGDASSSAIRLRRLRVRLAQEDGSPIVPADLASAFEVREGTSVYLRRTNLETSGDEIDLTLATPVTLTPADPVSLALRLDIASATAIGSFRLVIPDSSVFVAEDAISGQPVRVRLQEQSYPVRSGLARILSGGGALELSAPAPVVRRASSGQAGVTMATWQLAHSSTQSGSADLRLNAVEVRADVAGGPGSPLPWTRWRVLANGLVVNTHPVAATDTGDVRLDLVPAPVVQPGGSVALRLEADLDTTGAGRQFALEGVRFAEWDVRDVNSGDPAPVLTSGPVGGDTIRIETPAAALVTGPRPLMPATVAAGRTRLPVLDLVLRHPGPAGVAGVRMDSVRVVLHGPAGALLPMDRYLGALRLSRRGVALTTLIAPASGQATLVAARTLEAGTTDTLTVEVDVAADAPAGTIELDVPPGGIGACDANDGAAVSVTPEPPATFPFESGTAALVAPARELRVAMVSELPPLVAPASGAAVPAARLLLVNPGAAGSGPITVDHVVVSAATADGAPLALGTIAASADLSLGGALLGQSAPLAVDSATATVGFAAPVEIAAGDTLTLALALHPRAADPAARFRAGWRSDGIGVVQPASALLAIAVLAAPGASFPMWTDAAGFASADLGGSYVNFPNPFAAGRDRTTFAFLMPGPGRATLRILTPRGEPVVTLLDAAPLPAGLREADRWDGRNGRGDVVVNGVYVAELDVRFDDGSHQRVLRKVAVVR